MSVVNRTYKSSLFCKLFGAPDRKKDALELYNALARTNYDDPDELEINTIGDMVFLGRKNDISFLVGDEMVLLEHQSTHNPNMPMRGLLYFARLYTKHIETNSLDLYSTRRLEFPTPRFFVCYFGEAKRRDREIMRLSDSFADGPGDIEVTVTVVNCNEGRNEAILKACETLRGYAHLIALERHFRKRERLNASNAARRVVSQCIEDGFLAAYLAAHRAEVEDMLFTIEDEERAMRVHWEAVAREIREEVRGEVRDEVCEEIREEVREEVRGGVREEAREEVVAENRAMLAANAAGLVRAGKLSAEDAVAGLGLTEEELSAALAAQ